MPTKDADAVNRNAFDAQPGAISRGGVFELPKPFFARIDARVARADEQIARQGDRARQVAADPIVLGPQKRALTVAARPLDLDAFMPVTVGSAYFPKVVDQLRYYSQDKVLFRFVRTP